MFNLSERVAATQATKDRFGGTAFAWGRADCIVMAHFHLAQLGYPVPALPHYRSAAGGVRALKAIGFATVSDLLDTLLEPIPHANILPADLALMEGQKPFDALAVCAGRKLIGWHEDHDILVNLIPRAIKRAWRV